MSVRPRWPGALTVEGVVQVQRWFSIDADASIVCQPVPPDGERCRVNALGSRAPGARTFARSLGSAWSSDSAAVARSCASRPEAVG